MKSKNKHIKDIFIIVLIIIININMVSYAFEETGNMDYIWFDKEVTNVFVNPSDEPKLNSKCAVVFDRSSKTVLFGNNENEKVPMASTTKIMTAIIALENCNLSDIVKISKKAANTGGSTLGIVEGSNISLESLLYGLLLRSGNDTAVAIAEHIARKHGRFFYYYEQKSKRAKFKKYQFCNSTWIR